MEEIIETLKNADDESTKSPYWLILDPDQNMRRDVCDLAFQISGPFFCREDAQRYLDGWRYNYSKRAVVWCASGHYSKKYESLCELAESKKS